MASIENLSLVGYATAVSGLAFYPQTHAGYVQIAGPDRVAFLQRQTTNDLRLLTSERMLVTVLTTPAARILDVLTLVAEPEAIGALTLPDMGAKTADYFRSRIFFMDKVTVEDASVDHIQVDLLGPRSEEVLLHLGFDHPPQEDKILRAEMAGAPLLVLPQRGLGFRLLAATSAMNSLVASLAEAGAAHLSPESYIILQVEAGIPTTGQELTQDYTPLEIGLEWAVSDQKGCYTGQEVLARQRTYDKVIQHLVGLRLEGAAVVGERLWAIDEDRPVGTITSAVVSPRFGPIALAVVRRPSDQPGTRLVVGEPPGTQVVTVTGLPFS